MNFPRNIKNCASFSLSLIVFVIHSQTAFKISCKLVTYKKKLLEQNRQQGKTSGLKSSKIIKDN